MNLPVLYEDADVIVIDKPAGILTEDIKLGIGHVHRLDRDTSGVLVFAKNEKAYEFLRKAFTDREVKKTYIAFIYGVMPEKKGVINFPIGRSRKDFRLRSAQPRAKGTLRDAVTRYEVVAADAQGKHSLIKVVPETGRTHQIRVHMKAVHHPIVGDPLYAPNHPADLGFTRLGLHAYTLDLPLPAGGRATITSPVPADFTSAMNQFPGSEVFIAS